MKTKIEIERLAEEALNSLDGIQQMEANDFLFTRIDAQLNAYHQQFTAVKYLSRLSVALGLFIALNVTTYYFLSGNATAPTVVKKQNSTAAEALAAEYNLSGNQYNY